MTHEQYRDCIEACVRCAQACEHCADACLGEENVKKMADCIRTDRDCAQLCWTAAGFMSRGSSAIQDVCRLCAELCDACGKECRKHDMDHCQKCADACDACAEECRRVAGAAV